VFYRNENTINEERMRGRKVQIAIGVLIVQSKASYPDRSYARMPGGRGILRKSATSYPFDWARPVEGVDDITDGQFLNRNLTARSQNARSDAEAMMLLMIAMAAIMVTIIVTIMVGLRWF
jgi:hypothetical protein